MTIARATMSTLGLVALSVALAHGDAPTPAVDDPDLDKPELLTEGSPRGHSDVPVPVESRRQAIEQELAGLHGEHPWAGSYYEGDGLGANLRLQLAPKAGAAVTGVGCMGLYGANEGAITQSADGTLELDFNWKNEEHGFGGFARTLVPVRWGERHYLIAPEKLLDFVNAIHRGFEPRGRGHGMYYLRDGDENKPVTGLPELPAEYLDLLRSEQRVFAVRQVERLPDRANEVYCETAWRLTIATDGDDKLRVGSELLVSEPPDVSESARVVEVNPSTAAVEIQIYVGDRCDDQSTRDAPTTAWRLASGRYNPEANSPDNAVKRDDGV